MFMLDCLRLDNGKKKEKIKLYFLNVYKSWYLCIHVYVYKGIIHSNI